MTVLFLQKDISYSADLGNHAITQRASYAVPAGKRAVLLSFIYELDELVATAVRTAAITLRLRGADILIAYSQNGIAIRNLHCYIGLELSAGDTVAIFTVNGSANTLGFHGYVGIREYQ